MAQVSKKQFNQIKKLYNSGKSINCISQELGYTVNALTYFFRKNNLIRRNRTETNAIRFKNKQPSFNLKSRLTKKDELLKIVGIMLYWGEGSKWKGEKIVDFANSDPEMIKVFINFLRKICGIDEKKIRIYLYCHEEREVQKLKKYWSNLTNVSTEQFTKPYINTRYNPAKRGKMKHGLIHIRYYDKKLLDLLLNWIEKSKKQFV